MAVIFKSDRYSLLTNDDFVIFDGAVPTFEVSRMVF